MKKQIDIVKRYLLILGCTILLPAGLTACTGDGYNDKSENSSQNTSTENTVHDVEAEGDNSEEEVYEFQIEVDEDGDRDEAEFSYNFSDDTEN